METESLSTYDNNRDADIMEGNVDSGDFDSSVDADMPQDKEEDSKSGDKDNIDCDERPCATDKELDLETESKKDFTTFESDVEEEEEDVPLNINADKSDDDSDGGDENLDESDRDEREDVEKEISEAEQTQNISDVSDSSVNNDKPASLEDGDESKKGSNETVDDDGADSEKFKAGPSDTEACGDNEQSSDNVSNKPASNQDNINVPDDLKMNNETILLSDDDTDESEKSKKEASDTNDNEACKESEQADVLNKPESVSNNDNDTLSNKSKEKDNEEGDVDKPEPVSGEDGEIESEEKVAETLPSDVDKPESVSGEDSKDESEKMVAETLPSDVDKPESVSGEDSKDESEKKAAETLPNEEEAVNANISEKGTSDDDKDSSHKPSEATENETKQSKEETDTPPEKDVQSPKGDSKSDELESSKGELEDNQPVTEDNNENGTDTKTAENKSEKTVDNSNVEKEQPVDNDKKSEVVEIVDVSDDEVKPKVVRPLKRKRKQYTDQNTSKSKRSDSVDRDPLEIHPNEDLPTNMDEDMNDEDMDEDFDPSLFCPDINMEVEEAPVITNSNVPPSFADDSKSPALIDPLFSTYVDEVTGAEVEFNLSPNEEALRRDTFGEKNPVQFTRIHCTACNMHLGSALDGQANRFVHPLLKVLICKNCYHFYTSGEFEKDEDGSELYCRWCGQGGQVMCCSNCEMVFCKKCIRINFDRKKMAEIRDSEDWICFHCNPLQLIPQRIHCAEFMEYVRTETRRASTLENSTQFMTTDHSQCCNATKRKAVDPLPNEAKKRKRRPREDPDYDPTADRSSPVPSTSGVVPPKVVPKVFSPKVPPRLVPIVPKPTEGSKVAAPNTPFKIGSTTFRPQIIGNIRPRGPYVVSNQIAGQTNPRQMFKLIPNLSTLTRFTTPRVGIATVRQPTPSTSTSTTAPAQTHEWFDKTVVATARVNSNLSYTLSQLNQSQAKAKTVQALAVVHNKLQEILSNSINSLIQIRKNLRVEFIAGVCTENPAPDIVPLPSGSGIRNTRFPAPATPNSLLKAPMTSTPVAATSAAQDDDVILVTSPTEPVPTPLQTPKKQVPIKLPSSVSLIKKLPNKIAPDKETPIPTSSGTPFLRVKPLTSLQSIPPECITIPDDDAKPQRAKVQSKPKLVIKKAAFVNAVNVLLNGKGKEDKVKKVETDTVKNNHTETREIKASQIDLKKPLSREVKKMMEVKVLVPKLSMIEEKIQKELMKGASESTDNEKKD